MNILLTAATILVLTFLSGIAMFWAFSTCDENDEYNRWD